MFQTLKQKIIKRKIKKGLADIAEAEIFIAFYEASRDEITDKKEKAQMELKIDNLRNQIEQNKKFISYAKKL